MTFEELIKGKNVAIVGPAKYLTNSEYGTEIDSHDIVVRINRGIELTDKYSNDIGTRTEVLYSCLIEKPENAGTIDPLFLKEEKKVQIVVAPPKSTFNGYASNTELHELVNRDKVKILKKHLSLRIVDHQFNNILAEKVKCRPNTGFIAIYDLLRYEPSSLSIYGFSFYLDGFLEGCKFGIEKDKKITEQQFSDKCYKSKRHIQKNMWEYAKKTLVNKKSINLDSTLEKILLLKNFSKEEYNKDVEKR